METTKVTEKLVVNANGGDIVLDGMDFTLNGYVEVSNAASLTIKNCRIYNMNVEAAPKNYWLKILGDITTKLTVINCFFGNNPGTAGVMYNLLEPTAKLMDGSSISENYFKQSCCTHNTINVYGADDNATIHISDNKFEVSAGTVRIGVKGEPVCTIQMDGNYVMAPHPDYSEADQGIVTIQPYGKQTTTFANMVINMNNNHSASEQVIYGYSGTNDTLLDETTMPTVLIDGIPVDVAIYH